MLTIILDLNPNIFILYMLLYMYITLLKQQIIKNLKKIKGKGKIFCTNINSKYTLIPFNIKKNYTGITKYFPADSKEWKDKIYFFNLNYVKNLPINNINIGEVIKTFLNIYLKNNILLRKYISRRQKRYSINKVFTSKPEIKYTSSKVIITIYIYDREFLVLFSTLIRRRKKIFLFIKKFINIYNYILKELDDLTWEIFFKQEIKKREQIENKKEKSVILLLKPFLLKDLIFFFHKELVFIRKQKMKLNFSILKFKEIFLYGLKNLLKEIISKFFYSNVNIILNIVNLQSIVFNSDTSTEFLKWKLRPRRAKITVVNLILKKIKLIKVNKIIDRARHNKNINFKTIENKYKNLNINSILYSNFYSLDNILYNLYKEFEKKVIFNYIKYKNIKGVRLEVKGRLTKRYRADRSIYKVRLKGGLRNIDASYRGLSTINFRGYTYSNVEYSMKISKRRIGAFAVKGWISGK